jgi:GT2 family glycosyltransferase
MDFTVGIITYERPDSVERLLDSIDKMSRLPDEVIVVDDSEEDDTKQKVNSRNADYKMNYIAHEGKRTQSEARNIVIDEATFEIICFLDDDTVVSEKWLEKIEETYANNPNIAGAAGPAITANDDLEPKFEIIRKAENQNEFNKFGEVKDQSDRWIPPEPVETDKFRGANMSFRKSMLEEYRFNEEYFGNGYREEDDLMIRLWKNNEKLIYHPEALVYHLIVEEGGSREAKDIQYWKGRNLIRFVKLNLPENYRKALLRLLIHTDGNPPPLWKDIAGMFVYRKSERIWKFKGYLDEVLDR